MGGGGARPPIDLEKYSPSCDETCRGGGEHLTAPGTFFVVG